MLLADHCRCIKFLQGTSDEVVDYSHGKQLHELCKKKYEPLWLSGGGHCNLELYPEYIRHLKKFVSFLNKPKPTSNGTKDPTVESSSNEPSNESTVESGNHTKASDNQNKVSTTSNAGTFELKSDLPEVSRISLDSRLEKSKKTSKPEKSRMSTDQVDRFRRKKGLLW